MGPVLPVVLGIAHLVVDASSNFVMMLLLRPARPFDVMWLLIAYNLVAFALQPVVGLVTDRLHRPREAMCLGLLLVAAAMLSLDAPFGLPLALTSLGNALFHVGGGALSSLATEGRASGPGLFIAPGAVGVALGTAAGQRVPAALWPIFGALLLFAVVGGLLPCPERGKAKLTALGTVKAGAWAIVALLLLAIALRSLLGARAVGHLKLHEGWALPLAVAAFTGKAFGGVVGDRVGWKWTAVVTLLVSSFLLAFADQSLWIAAAAMVSFQGVTAITLSALYRVLPGRIALSFGLACLAIFVGALPLLTRVRFSAFEGIPLDSALALASVAAVWGALSLLERTPASESREAVSSSASHPDEAGRHGEQRAVLNEREPKVARV